MVAAIAEEDYIGYLLVGQNLRECLWPFRQGAEVIDPVRKPPVQAVAAIEIDFEYVMPRLDQPLAEATEEWPHKALQQKYAALWAALGLHVAALAPT
ncbi:MAG TPA: hypothetical protein PK823_01340 [Novosphingobium sp.]|nr:hypothetical protein [Novosphingobium sp.]